MSIMGITGIIGAIALLFIKEKSKSWVEIIIDIVIYCRETVNLFYLLPTYRRATQTPQINCDFVIGGE